LEASADFLARQYLDLRAWRLPEPEFQAFHQVLVVVVEAGRVEQNLQTAGTQSTEPLNPLGGT
jgi:hypothetical protein